MQTGCWDLRPRLNFSRAAPDSNEGARHAVRRTWADDAFPGEPSVTAVTPVRSRCLMMPLVLAATACATSGPSPKVATVVSPPVAGSASPSPVAPRHSAERRPCRASRALNVYQRPPEPGEDAADYDDDSDIYQEKPVPLPRFVAPRTPCDALRAVYPDYDDATQMSKLAGGLVRAHGGFDVTLNGTRHLVLTFYRQGDADGQVGNCVSVGAHVALLRARDSGFELVARTDAAVNHMGGSGLTRFNSDLTFEPGEALLGFSADEGCGNGPSTTAVGAFRVQGKRLALVLVATTAHGRVEGDEFQAHVASSPSTGRRFDQVLSWRKRRCTGSGDQRKCSEFNPAGTQRLRFNGTKFVTAGPAPQLW